MTTATDNGAVLVQQTLNDIGANGWELVGMNACGFTLTWVFKRPKHV